MRYVVLNSLTFLFFLSGCVVPIDKESLFPSAPDAAENLAITPVSPSNNQTPTVTGTAKADASLKLFSARNCKGTQIGTGTVDTAGRFSMTSSTLSEGSYEFSVQVTFNKKSACSSYVPYAVDLTPPTVRFSAPLYSLVNSTSPAVDYYVTFMGAATVNLTSSDITLNRTGTADCSTVVANGSTFIATVSLSGCTGSGTVGISVAAGVATDNVGNTNLVSGESSVFNVDNSGVTSAVYNPPAAIYEDVPNSVTITFPETILGTSVTSGDFIITGTCTTLPSLILTSAVGSAATVSLAGASCSPGQTTILTTNLAGISDAAGNAGSGTASVTYTIDNIGPTSVSFNPLSARVTAIPASVDVTFNEAVTSATVTAADFNVTGTCAVLPTLSVAQVSGTIATVALVGATCNLDQTVDLEVDLSGIDDLLGNAGAGNFNETYTFDNVGPAAISINQTSALVSAIPAFVDISYDEALYPISLVPSDLIITGSCTTLPTASDISINAGTVRFGLGVASCTNGQTVIVTMNGPSVTDAAGNTGSGSVNATYTFDDIGPAVSSISPATGSVNAVPNSVSIFFDEALLPSSVDASDVSISGTCGTLPTASFISISGSTAVFGLNGAVCANGEAVVVTMDGVDITDAAGNAGTGSYTTTYTIDSVGPTPLSISPNTANVQSIPPTVTVTFDKSILASSVAASDLNISGTCGTLPVVSVSGVSGAVATFSLSGGSCAEGETVVASISGADVTDNIGNAGSSSQMVTYLKDTTGPSVLSFSPGSQTLMSVPTLVNVNFDESLMSASVTSADFAVTGSCTTLPTTSVLSVSGQQVLVGISGGACADGESFSLTANQAGISDTAGNAGAGTSAVTFTIDNVGPTLSSVNPNLGAPPAAVFLNFSENLDSASVDVADFSLGGTCATASIGLTGVANNVVELAISGIPCTSGETVEITVNAANVKDAVGNSGSGSSVVIFTEP